MKKLTSNLYYSVYVDSSGGYTIGLFEYPDEIIMRGHLELAHELCIKLNKEYQAKLERAPECPHCEHVFDEFEQIMFYKVSFREFLCPQCGEDFDKP